MRISTFASKPPDASTTAPAAIVSRPFAVRTTTPVTPPRSSVTSRMALASKRTSMPALAAEAYAISMRPGPPPTASRTSPPQKWNLPSTLYAWRPNIGIHRMPRAFIQRTVAWDSRTTRSARSGSARSSVTRMRSS